MDRLSAWMVRASFVWLAVGVVVGGVMLSDQIVPGSWRIWFGPAHGHILFVGWLAQFAIGIAYWLLPRRRGERRPLGYDERAAMIAAVMLNVGLGLRVLAEPVERAEWNTSWTAAAEAASAVLQAVAVLVFVQQLWSRAAPRPAAPRSTSR